MGIDQTDDRVAAPDLTGAGTELAVAVVAGRFNSHVTLRLLDGVHRGLDVTGAAAETHWVPGAFEIPLTALTLAATHRYAAVVCIGSVIRGDTAHFDHVAGQCAAGIQRVSLDTGVPAIFGVLTTDNLDQALARSEGPGGHNVGEEAALTAIEMALTLAAIRANRS